MTKRSETKRDAARRGDGRIGGRNRWRRLGWAGPGPYLLASLHFYLTSLMPGPEKTSSWRRPFLSRNSMAVKSFLSMPTLLSNSRLAVWSDSQPPYEVEVVIQDRWHTWVLTVQKTQSEAESPRERTVSHPVHTSLNNRRRQGLPSLDTPVMYPLPVASCGSRGGTADTAPALPSAARTGAPWPFRRTDRREEEAACSLRCRTPSLPGPW